MKGLIIMLINESGKVVEKTYDKVQTVRQNKISKEGKEYVYKNYRTYMSKEYMDVFGLSDHMYLYLENGKVYVTGTEPDGSVPMKRISLHKQKGNSNLNNGWKRVFILPKKFFPKTKENQRVVFTYDISEVERFSGVHATLTIDVVD